MPPFDLEMPAEFCRPSGDAFEEGLGVLLGMVVIGALRGKAGTSAVASMFCMSTEDQQRRLRIPRNKQHGCQVETPTFVLQSEHAMARYPKFNVCTASHFHASTATPKQAVP